MLLTVIYIVLFIVIFIFGITAFTGAPYVPTHAKEINFLFEDLYKITDKDKFVDIGSGDGSVLVGAARRGASVLGYEINPILVVISILRLRSYRHRAKVKLSNFWKSKLPDDTTIVYTFGEDRDIYRMYKYVKLEATRLDKNIMFISYGFKVKGIKPYKSSRAYHVYKIRPLHGV